MLYFALNDICIDDVKKCNAVLDQLAGGNTRTKRGADVAALLEMALLTEGTYEATVDSVSATEITFTPPALPAGDYAVIVNVDGQAGRRSCGD